MEEEHDQEHKSKKHQKDETITLSKDTIWKLASGILGILLLVSIFTDGFQLKNNSPQAIIGAPAPNEAAAQPAPSAPNAKISDMKTLADDDPFIGDKNAPVTMVEFSDYECPFCARFYQQTLPQIKSDYIGTGKVKFVYRDFPLGFHAQAEPAAIAANCAGEQGKYFEYHDKIFSNNGAGGKSSTDYKQWAQELKLDVAKWEICLNDPIQKQEIQKDIKDGIAAGISGTPGFIINSKLVSGAQPFNVFKQIIDSELN